MSAPPFPDEDNAYLAEQVAILRRSFRHWTRRALLDPRMSDAEAARYLWSAPYVMVSHNADPDPLFNYGNRTALSVFGMTWEQFAACPSRSSAERADQEARAELLKTVEEQGYLEGYRGIRVGRHGRRFEIEDAVIWNLRDERGTYCGQAASFKHWKWV